MHPQPSCVGGYIDDRIQYVWCVIVRFNGLDMVGQVLYLLGHCVLQVGVLEGIVVAVLRFEVILCIPPIRIELKQITGLADVHPAFRVALDVFGEQI